MTNGAAALRNMLANIAGSETKDADLLLMQMSPVTAALMELCAIPHMFGEPLLRVLDPAVTDEVIKTFLAELPYLPAVTQVGSEFCLHDIVREQMFYRWLAPERAPKFSAVSRRLAEYFSASESSSVQAGMTRSITVFHQLGANIETGFTAFQTLYRAYRASMRYSACDNLIRLVREYRPVLSNSQLAWLGYYEAETASDSRNPARAAALLTELSAKDLPAGLKICVLTRLSAALRETNRSKAAQTYASSALEFASATQEGQSLLHLVHLELGLIARQQGDVETAERHLNTAIELGRAAGDRLVVASAYNSLGMMMQKMMPQRAVEMFEASVARLDQNSDLARIAQVLNNLGLAYANAGDWEKSRISYERSLDIKRAAADLYGQALTQLNVARVYLAQRKEVTARNALTESATLFESVNDLTSAASARRELARALKQAGMTDDAIVEIHSAAALYMRLNQPDAAAEIEREFGKALTPKRSWFKWLIQWRFRK